MSSLRYPYSNLVAGSVLASVALLYAGDCSKQPNPCAVSETRRRAGSVRYRMPCTSRESKVPRQLFRHPVLRLALGPAVVFGVYGMFSALSHAFGGKTNTQQRPREDSPWVSGSV